MYLENIADAETIKLSLKDLQRRADHYAHDRNLILVGIGRLIADLQSAQDLIEQRMLEEVQVVHE
jgi:hypothetical protein